MKTITASASLSLVLCCATTTYADSFGSGLNTFDIEFVTIGNPGNAADTTGSPIPAGKVDDTYRMGKFEISEDMINKANTLGSLGLSHNNRGADKPATHISWFEAATFVNWLNTSTGSTPAYKVDDGTFQLWAPGDAGYNPNNLYRNSLATYFLPSVDEWYKAAYYDPIADVYHDYPTGSDNVPTAVTSGTTVNTAVYGQSFAARPAVITLVGGMSPYGTMGQGGNVFEWEETAFELVNDSSSSGHGVRGGFWRSSSADLLSSVRFGAPPDTVGDNVGFRVASIPEPSTLLLGALAVVGLLLRRRRCS